MGQKFCIACGAKLTDGVRFCENCGAPCEPAPATSPGPSPVMMDQAPGPVPVSTPVPAGTPGKFPVKIIGAAIIILLIIAAVAVVVVLPKMQGGSIPAIPGLATPVPTTIPTPVPTPTTVATTVVPTPTPEPFPGAMPLGQQMAFGSGKVASQGTVYRYWINDTYQWHNDMDNKYYTHPPTPKPGMKYLFVFVRMENIGDDRVWLPPSGSVQVHYNDATYREDQTHYKPDKSNNLKATPIEVQEIQYFHNLNNDRYVEDFGYSAGTELGYIYPGKSNAVDGYIIYEVPKTLTPDKTYVTISFNGQDSGVWKLA